MFLMRHGCNERPPESCEARWSRAEGESCSSTSRRRSSDTRGTLDVNASGTGADIEPDQADMAFVCLSVDGPAFDVDQITRL